jgi:hypothetical protein
MHRAMFGEKNRIDAEQGVLELGVVGHHSPKHDSGSARDRNEFGHEESSGERLGNCNRETLSCKACHERSRVSHVVDSHATLE